MTLPAAPDVLAAIRETWPAARAWRSGPWIIRDGAGGGRRASAATAVEPVTRADLPLAEAGQEAFGQTPIFQVSDEGDALLPLLEAEGYAPHARSHLYAAPVELLCDVRPPRVTTFAIWPPLAIMSEVWAENDVPAERLAVMERAACQKTAILGRLKDRVAGVGYVGVSGNIAALHALVVEPAFRRQGLGDLMMRQAALWARDEGAEYLALAVTSSNHAARALYASLGLEVVGQYHYRIKG